MAEKQETLSSVSEVRKQIDDTNDTLTKQVTNVELRQQELQNMISNIESNISLSHGMIAAEKKKAKPDWNAIKGMQGNLMKNLELLAKYYEVYKQFEETKFKYHNVMNDNIHKGMKLIHVDIKRIEKDLDKVDGQDFAQVMALLKTGFQESAKRDNLEKESVEVFESEEKYKL